MSAIGIIIVIPTCNRAGLLETTLMSLSECELPNCVTRVILAENGEKFGAEALAKRFIGQLPIEYRFVAMANKSRALNEVLAHAKDEFVIFYDDDVRIDRDNPAAYLRALGKSGRGTFLGGRCEVDYEETPPAWLLPYLPPSAKGWGHAAPLELKRSGALGFNWGAFANEIKELGGFNEQRGPGTRSRGQETDMQERMLASGICGYYVPDAVVWHYVPKHRCSCEWTLERAEQTAFYCGVELSKKALVRRVRHRTLCTFKVWSFNALLRTLSDRLPIEHRFHYLHQLRWHVGMLNGLRVGLERR